MRFKIAPSKLWIGSLLCLGVFHPVSLLAGGSVLKADVSFQNGQVYLRARNYAKAIEVFTLAIQLNPQHDRAYHQRGSGWYYLKDYEKACQDWQKACQLNHACMGWNFGKYQKLCAVPPSEQVAFPESEQVPSAVPQTPVSSPPKLPTTLE